MASAGREFIATIQVGANGSGYLELPFDAAEAWGAKERHHVTGTVNGMDVRGPLTQADGAWRLSLGPAWLRRKPIAPGDEVRVILAAEGPQRDVLAPDLAAALEANPDAGAYFDSLATFYRKGYLKWLDGALRRPVVREQRIEEWIRLLKAGRKTREDT